MTISDQSDERSFSSEVGLCYGGELNSYQQLVRQPIDFGGDWWTRWPVSVYITTTTTGRNTNANNSKPVNLLGLGFCLDRAARDNNDSSRRRRWKQRRSWRTFYWTLWLNQANFAHNEPGVKGFVVDVADAAAATVVTSSFTCFLGASLWRATCVRTFDQILRPWT